MEIRSLSFLILSLMVIFAILPSGEARKCYVCSSEQEDCPASKHEKTCPSETDFCFKCHAKITDGSEATVRSCIDGMNQISLDSAECAVCNSDLCNNANTINTNIMTAIGCLALIGAIRFGFS